MLDMEKMRAKYRSLKEGGEKRIDPLNWKPENGPQDIRIVCPEDGDPFKEFHVHYRIGDEAPFLCPKKNFGESCSVCEFAWGLYEEGDTKSAKELLPSARYVSPIVVRGDESTVKLWNYSRTIYSDLIGYVNNPEYDDITHKTNGIDLTLTYDAEAAKNRQLATKIMPKRHNSPLAETEEQADSILATIPDANKKYLKKSTLEVGKILDAFLSADPTGGEPGGTEKYGTAESEIDSVFKQLEETK